MKLLKIFFAPFLGCLILVIACHKSGHEGQTTAAINIQGFELIDFSGNLIGWQGRPTAIGWSGRIFPPQKCRC